MMMKQIVFFTALAFSAAIISSPVLAKTKQGPGNQQKQQEEEPGKAEKFAPYEDPFPTKMTWTLQTISGKPTPAEATLHIDESLRGSGVSGCNTWSAALYPVRGKRLAMGPVAMTKKTCSPELNAFEKAYLIILHTGPVWEQSGSTLKVKSQAGELIFNRGL